MWVGGPLTKYARAQGNKMLRSLICDVYIILEYTPTYSRVKLNIQNQNCLNKRHLKCNQKCISCLLFIKMLKIEKFVTFLVNITNE